MPNNLGPAVKLDHNTKHSAFRITRRGDNALPNLFLHHDHNKGRGRIDFEKLPQDRRGDVVRKIGDELIRAETGGIEEQGILRHNGHVAPVVKALGEVTGQYFILFDRDDVGSRPRQRFGQYPKSRPYLEDVLSLSQFSILNYEFYGPFIQQKILPKRFAWMDS